eukprot:gene30534-35563_t
MEGKDHGKGKYAWLDGRLCEVCIKDNCKFGGSVAPFGWRASTMQIGRKARKMHIYGKGKYAWSDGQLYEGQWADNKMHGLGVYTDTSGHKWEGQFYNGSGPGLTLQL